MCAPPSCYYALLLKYRSVVARFVTQDFCILFNAHQPHCCVPFTYTSSFADINAPFAACKIYVRTFIFILRDGMTLLLAFVCSTHFGNIFTDFFPKKIVFNLNFLN